MAGWIAPFLLCVLRFGQGFGLGGEWGGAALLAVENAPPGWKARFGMFPQLGAPVGFLAANGLFLILGLMLTPEQFLSWGWRIPVPAQRGAGGHRPVGAAEPDRDPGLQGEAH
jgi:MFS family permease